MVVLGDGRGDCRLSFSKVKKHEAAGGYAEAHSCGGNAPADTNAYRNTGTDANA